MILKLFSQRPDHPLADGKELKRILGELLVDRPVTAVDEVTTWFESLKHARNFRIDQLFDILRQLDDAAQPHLRRLTRDYLQSQHLSAPEQQRLWTKCHGYWRELAAIYSLCLERARLDPKSRGSELLKPALPLVETRVQAARRCRLKWLAYRYAPVEKDLWQGLGASYLAAEEAGLAQKPVQLYPAQKGLTSVAQQYLHALIFDCSSMDQLLPEQIEMADRLIAQFLSGVVLSTSPRPDSVYWVDAASGVAPARLVRRPADACSSQRFFSPAPALAALTELIHAVERGDVPRDLNLGAEYQPKALLPVLRHLCTYWALQPPRRTYQRHPVRTRMAVLDGFEHCFMVFAGAAEHLHGEAGCLQHWLVENVSLGGFRAIMDGAAANDRIKLGTLLCLQVEGGDNWLLGVVRRFGGLAGGKTGVGVQVLSRRAQSVELRPRRSGFAVAVAVPGICLRDRGETGVLRMVLPLGGFRVRESLDLILDGRPHVLTPMELEESGSDFEIARFREPAAG